MKLRLYLKGRPEMDESLGYPCATKGPLWCEIEFVGDGTPGTVEFLFDGTFWISNPESLLQKKKRLLESLEIARSQLLSGPTQCDGKTIIHVSRSRKLSPWTPQHVGYVANQVGNLILQWVDRPAPTQEELDEIRGPEPHPELAEKIQEAMEYQRRMREEYRRTGVRPTDDPFMTYPDEAYLQEMQDRRAGRGSKPRKIVKRRRIIRKPSEETSNEDEI